MSQQQFKVGDRVCKSIDGPIVPKGALGTIARIYVTTIKVNWDRGDIATYEFTDNEIEHATLQTAQQTGTVSLTPGSVWNAPPNSVIKNLKAAHAAIWADSSITPISDLIGSNYGYVSDEDRKKRKEAGQCEECGTLLPMSIHGMGECPHHPKPLPPGHKQ